MPLEAQNGGHQVTQRKIAKSQNKNLEILFVVENIFAYMESFDFDFVQTNDEKVVKNLVFHAI